MQPATFWTNVSSLAVCQRCPILFGYNYHLGEPVWFIGIKGSNNPYGSMFHKNIARVFFEAASDPRNPLHTEIPAAVSGGEAALEEFVRTRIFLPFLEEHSGEYGSGQLMAAARGVVVWVKAMADFFAEIPSLKRNINTIFLAPEQKLKAYYNFPGEGRLAIVGCYDALLFNPDKAEARLFEFKGYAKSNLTVPLSQSLMYAWLVNKYSGIVPSVEVIYLDEEDRKPDIFDPKSVSRMIRSGLPGLFQAAFNTITLRRMPEIVKDKKLCSVCKFRKTCASDWAGGFGKRKGASMLNVLVFFLLSLMITTQMFFLSHTSSETMAAHSEAMQRRFAFERYLYEALNLNDKGIKKLTVKTPTLNGFDENTVTIMSQDASGDLFPITITRYPFASYDIDSGRKVATFTDGATANAVTYDLNCTLSFDSTAIDTDSTSSSSWRKKYTGDNLPNMIFPAMGSDYYLVRIYEPSAPTIRKRLMYQVLVKKNGTNTPEIKSFQEVWY